VGGIVQSSARAARERGRADGSAGAAGKGVREGGGEDPEMLISRLIWGLSPSRVVGVEAQSGEQNWGARLAARV